jgi:hypothetical protein
MIFQSSIHILQENKKETLTAVTDMRDRMVRGAHLSATQKIEETLGQL